MDEYIDNNDISIDFHGVEMRDLSDKKVLVNVNAGQEVVEIITKSNIPLRVYIQRGRKATAIVTFHDIGTNNNSFLSFFNFPNMSVILENFTVYNICAPGHHGRDSRVLGRSTSADESFRLLSAGKSTENGGEDRKTYLSTNYPTMDELAEMVEAVAEHFRVECFIGMGVGAGANILARYGVKFPTKVLGLFLINADDTRSGYYEWAKARWFDLPSLRSGVVTEWLEDYLSDHWFGATAERDPDTQEHSLQILREMNHESTAGYIESYMNRTALGLVRPIVDGDKTTRHIDAQTLLLTGEFSTDLSSAMFDMNGNMDPSKTQFLTIPDSSGMVMEDAPEKVANVFLNFLRNLGLMATMSPEKLRLVTQERESCTLSTEMDPGITTLEGAFPDRC